LKNQGKYFQLCLQVFISPGVWNKHHTISFKSG